MKYCRLLLVGSLLAFAQLASAQAPPPGGGGGGGSTGAPVDGASGLLLIAAVAYGYNRLRKQDGATSEEQAK